MTPRIGYAPYTAELNRPGDRRRFVRYAELRGIEFEVADPSRSYDVVVLSSRADISRWADRPRTTKIVYDLIDSYLRLPRHRPKNLLRGMAKFVSGELSRPVLSYTRAIHEMCRRADAVVCSTAEQANDISEFSDEVHTILDFHDEFGDVHKESFIMGDTFNIVWEGLPATMGPLRSMNPVFDELSDKWKIVLHLVTDLRSHRFLDRVGVRETLDSISGIHSPVFLYQWSVFGLSHIATGCDAAIIPLDLRDPMSYGKPENKLDLFWRLGLPTVVSPSPAHRRAMSAAGVDMVCEDLDDWKDALNRLGDDEKLRRRTSEAGRAYVVEHHSTAAIAAKWDDVMVKLL